MRPSRSLLTSQFISGNPLGRSRKAPRCPMIFDVEIARECRQAHRLAELLLERAIEDLQADTKGGSGRNLRRSPGPHDYAGLVVRGAARDPDHQDDYTVPRITEARAAIRKRESPTPSASCASQADPTRRFRTQRVEERLATASPWYR